MCPLHAARVSHTSRLAAAAPPVPIRLRYEKKLSARGQQRTLAGKRHGGFAAGRDEICKLLLGAGARPLGRQSTNHTVDARPQWHPSTAPHMLSLAETMWLTTFLFPTPRALASPPSQPFLRCPRSPLAAPPDVSRWEGRAMQGRDPRRAAVDPRQRRRPQPPADETRCSRFVVDAHP